MIEYCFKCTYLVYQTWQWYGFISSNLTVSIVIKCPIPSLFFPNIYVFYPLRPALSYSVLASFHAPRCHLAMTCYLRFVVGVLFRLVQPFPLRGST